MNISSSFPTYKVEELFAKANSSLRRIKEDTNSDNIETLIINKKNNAKRKQQNFKVNKNGDYVYSSHSDKIISKTFKDTGNIYAVKLNIPLKGEINRTEKAYSIDMTGTNWFTCSYDSLGRLTNIKNQDSEEFSYKYYKNTLLIKEEKETNSNGFKFIKTFNPNGTLKSEKKLDKNNKTADKTEYTYECTNSGEVIKYSTSKGKVQKHIVQYSFLDITDKNDISKHIINQFFNFVYPDNRNYAKRLASFIENTKNCYVDKFQNHTGEVCFDEVINTSLLNEHKLSQGKIYFEEGKIKDISLLDKNIVFIHIEYNEFGKIEETCIDNNGNTYEMHYDI